MELSPGTVLTGRYLLRALAEASRTTQAWRAIDQSLEREVRILVVTSERIAPLALDAARRAALVNDPRLVRILDVVPAPGEGLPGYIVLDPYRGTSLKQLVERSYPRGVDPQLAHSLIGETAAALDNASRLGVHHGAIDGDHVLTNGSAILVLGLGTAIANAPALATSDDLLASERDATALVRLLY